MLSKTLRSIRPAFSQIAALTVVLFSLVLFSASYAVAQSSDVRPELRPVADRLTSPVVEEARVTLGGSVHRLATKANDRGAVSDGMKLDRIQIVLKRSDAQETALKQLIGQMHSPGSASYHKWLTPEDFGKQFGPSDADVTKLENWLASKGFSITKLNPGRQTLEIAGTAGQFKSTFHTEVHSFQVPTMSGPEKTETRFSAVKDPEIPAALAPVFGGFVQLNNFRFKSHAQLKGGAEYNPVTHEAKPEWSVGTTASPFFLLGPGDFAVQYDLNPLYTASPAINGTGQSIAIVNESNINIAQVNNYRSLFGLPVNPPQVIIDGNDPGIDGINSPFGSNYASGEAYLDVELSGAAAPNAQINLVIANDTVLESGLTLAIERAVYSNVSPIISLSFGGCEVNQGPFNGFISSLWEQAAAQGITVLVSSGDQGSAGCDNDNSQYFAVHGQAVNGLASTPYNIAVGGTDFYYSGGTTDTSTYWSSTNGAGLVSLTKKVPEQPFNSSQFGQNLSSVYNNSGGTSTSIFAASGGASTSALADSSGNYTLPYPKPSWQKGTGVPADGVRDLPDVSLFGALASSLTITPVCANDGDCLPDANGRVYISEYGGTSLSAPSFAGIMALVDQKYGRQGQANYVLYPLAAQFPAAFNDVTVGTNAVPCNTTTVFDTDNGNASVPVKQCQTVTNPLTVTDPRYGSSAEGQISVTGSGASYNAGVGYDLASGLGSVDANTLLTDWGKVTFGATTTTLTATPTTFAHGAAVTLSGTVKAPSGGTTPTGDVALTTTSTDQNTQSETFFTLASGAYSGSVNYLPGGTYNISASYGGDGKNGESTSTPVQVTVTPEASTTLLTVYGSLPTSSSNAGALGSGTTIDYGSEAALSAVIEPTSSASQKAGYGTATGNVTFLNGTTVLNQAVVNAEGDAEYNSALVPGSYSITAKYSGDGSYGASTSAATTFTVAKNTPVLNVGFTNADSNDNAINNQTTYVTVQVENSANSNAFGVGPTGTVTLQNATTGTSSTATLVPAVDPRYLAPEGVAYFTLPAGTTATQNLTFTYNGDTNYATNSTSGGIAFDAGSGIGTTITASATPVATSPAARVQATITVAAKSGAAPQGAVYLYSNNYELDAFTLPTGSAGSVTVTISLTSGELYQGTNVITAQYVPASGSPDAGSATIFTIANPLSDFSLIPVTTVVNVPGPGTTTPGVQTDTINLQSYDGFAGAVSLACKGSGGVTCSLGSSSSTLAAGGQNPVVLTVNTGSVTAAGTYNVIVTGTDSTGHLIHTIGLQVVTPLISSTPSFTLGGTAVSIASPGTSGNSTITVTPANGFTGTVALTCSLTGPAGAVSTPTCSAASASVTGTAAVTTTLTFNTTATTTAGSYTATVTGTSGTTTATTSVAVTVGSATATPSFTLGGTAVAIAAPGDTGTSTITVTPAGGFTGTVALTCSLTGPTGAVSTPTCSAASASVTGTTAATATLTFNTTATTTAGSYTATVTGTSGTTTATTTVAVTVTGAVSTSPTFTLAGTAVTIQSQGAPGTSTITVTPTNGFTGTVALTCAVATTPSGAVDVPTCTGSSVTVSSATEAASGTLTFATTAQTGALTPASKRLFGESGGAVLALLALVGIAGRRNRRSMRAVRAARILSIAVLFALIAGAGIGCGGGGHPAPTGGTTTGMYTYTVTGTSGTTTATTTVSVTVN